MKKDIWEYFGLISNIFGLKKTFEWFFIIPNTCSTSKTGLKSYMKSRLLGVRLKKKISSVAFFRNIYVGETEWLRVTITFWMVTRNQYDQSEMITVKSLFFWKFLRMKDVFCIQVSHSKSANIFRLFRNKWNIYSTQKNFYVMISNFESCVVVTKNVIITKLNSFRNTFTSTWDVTRTWNDYSAKSHWRGQYEFLHIFLVIT